MQWSAEPVYNMHSVCVSDMSVNTGCNHARIFYKAQGYDCHDADTNQTSAGRNTAARLLAQWEPSELQGFDRNVIVARPRFDPSLVVVGTKRSPSNSSSIITAAKPLVESLSFCHLSRCWSYPWSSSRPSLTSFVGEPVVPLYPAAAVLKQTCIIGT